MSSRFTALARRWQRWPVLVSLFILVALALWLAAWQPARERLLLAEQRYVREQALARDVMQAMAGTSRTQEGGQAITPAGLSASAKVAGLQLQGLDLRQEQLNLSVQGQPEAVLLWLHQVEVLGGRFASLSLQMVEASMQAHMTLQAQQE